MQTEKRIKDCSGSERARSLVSQWVAASAKALKEAELERQHGSVSLPALWEDVALESAELACDLVAADEREQAALKAERELSETLQAVKRARAYLEETEARRGRALAQLERTPPATSTTTAPSPPAPSSTATPASATPASATPAGAAAPAARVAPLKPPSAAPSNPAAQPPSAASSSRGAR